jgi:hypothetical protein
MTDAADRCMACLQPRGGAAVCPACGFDESKAEHSPRHLPLRTVLAGRYLIGRVLGEGGFGITYAAWDLTLANRRAIKEYFPDDAAHRADGVSVAARSRSTRALYDEGLERFLTEARTLEKFQDEPGIVQVRDFFPANGTGYLVMGFLEGRTVKALLEEHGGRFDYAVALPLLLPVMDALQKVHDSGLLHRDISPDNLMITLNRQVRLLDFGAAKSLVSDRSRSTGSVFKKGYTPYEQYLEDARLGPPTDVYALAATLWRMLTGRVPPGALERRQADTLEPPSALGVAMPPAAEQALMRALAIEPQHRPATVREFRQALVDAGTAAPAAPRGTPAPAPRPAPAPTPAPSTGGGSVRPRRWGWIALGAGGLAALGGIAWFAGNRSPSVVSVDFPAQITVGRTATLRIQFEDPDGDADRMEFVSREGSWKIANQDLRRFAGQTRGTVEIPMNARSPETARVDVVVHDRQNHRSRPHEIRFTSVAPPAVAPVLLRVQAPPTATAGVPFMTRAQFEDGDGDARRLVVKPLTAPGNFPPVELSGVQRQGQVNYQITVGSPGRYAYSYQIQDAQGLGSNLVQVEVNVLPAPTRRAPAVAPPPRPGLTPGPAASQNLGQVPAPTPTEPPPVRPGVPDATRILNDLLRGSGLKR